jgi:hypothetical protein
MDTTHYQQALLISLFAMACEPKVNGADCDPDTAIFPGQVEICGDGIDNDCDGAIDESDAIDASLWYYDGDGDGYGDPATTEVACTAPSYFVEDHTDCDDSDPDINPDTFWAPDADNDGFGDLDSSTWVQSCEQPSGSVLDATDCDDGRDDVNPEAKEQCDEVDHDCDGSTGWVDEDGDGWAACEDDCDDGDPDIHPGADEHYDDGVDQDCDGYEGCDAPWAYDASTGPLYLASDAELEGFCQDYLAICDDVFMSLIEDYSLGACLEAVTGFLYVWSEGATEVELEGLREVGDLLTITSTTTEHVSLPSLVQVGGLDVAYHTSLETLELPALERVDEELRIADGGNLSECELPALVEAGELRMEYVQGRLSSWSFPALQRLEHMNFYQSSALTLSAPQLTDIDDSLAFTESSVASLDLPSLERIGGNLWTYHSRETTIDLPALLEIGEDLAYCNSWTLEELSMPSLATIGGDFCLSDEHMETLELPALTSVDSMWLESDDTLATLSLPSLQSVTSRFYLELAGITDLDGLAGLRSVGSDLTITGNTSLSDISGLHGLDSVGADLTITDNASLSDVQAWDLVHAIGKGDIGGAITISGNGE